MLLLLLLYPATSFYVSLVCLISDDEYWYTCQIRLHSSCIVSMMKTNILQDFSEGFVNIRCRQPQSPLAFNLISCLPGPYLIQDTIRIYQDIYILTAKEEGLQTKTIIMLYSEQFTRPQLEIHSPGGSPGVIRVFFWSLLFYSSLCVAVCLHFIAAAAPWWILQGWAGPQLSSRWLIINKKYLFTEIFHTTGAFRGRR